MMHLVPQIIDHKKGFRFSPTRPIHSMQEKCVTPEHILRDKLRKIEALFAVRQRPERKLPRAQLQNASERGLDKQQPLKSPLS
jgi:hypothetical protein